MNKIGKTVIVNMYYGASELIINRAKELRRNPTKTEEILWSFLKNNSILGLRFRRQHPIKSFIADFYCHKIKLVIEVDGEIHNKYEIREKDDNRNAEMERLGLTLLRFSNFEVENTINTVLQRIYAECEKLLNENKKQ
ncbi:MAG: endonuclease domain-containing protein [Bacteroidetes bacterium]|nr:MAG: endonuclease domain-containing protein [Bacteroidota bacterium]